jgi:hypothetical protein
LVFLGNRKERPAKATAGGLCESAGATNRNVRGSSDLPRRPPNSTSWTFRFNSPWYHQRIGQGVERMRMSPLFNKCEGFASVVSVSDCYLWRKTFVRRNQIPRECHVVRFNGLRLMYIDRKYITRFCFVDDQKCDQQWFP